MKRKRLPPAPPERPAHLRTFDPAAWLRPGEALEQVSEWYDLRQRWIAARVAWGVVHGVDPGEMLRQDRRERRALAFGITEEA